MVRIAAVVLVATLGGFAGFKILRKKEVSAPAAVQQPEKPSITPIGSPQDAESWIAGAYTEISEMAEKNFKSQYPDQARGMFADSAGSELLEANHTVPGFFSQECFNGYAAAQFQDKAKTLEKKFAELKLKGTANEILQKLYERYRSEYAGEWEKYLEGIQIKPFGDAMGARNGLQALSGAVSTNPALAKIITEVWRRRVITIDGTPYNVPRRGIEWLKLANDRLTALAKTVDDFLKKTQEGQRFRDYVDNKGKVRDKVELSDAFNTALSEMEMAVGSGIDQQDQFLRTAVMKFMPAPIHRAREAFASEAREEMNRYWDETAVAHFKKTLAGKYPFVRAAEIDATTKDFNEFFKPETGLLAKIEYYLKTLNDITIHEKPLLKYTPEYEAALAHAQRMQAILYALNKNTVSTKVSSITTTSPQHYGHVMLKVKAVEVDLKSMISFRCKDAVWEGGQSVYFILKSDDRPNKILYEDKPETYWGLFRLADSGQIKDKGTGKDYEMSWEYLPSLTIKLMLTCDDKNNPFATDFFSKFACPETVGE